MVNQENKLKKQLQEQQETIARLSSRISDMSDRFVAMRSEMDNFKEDVSQDLRRMVNILKQKV